MAPTTPTRPRKQQIKTPKRQEIFDRYHISHQKPPKIKEITGVPTSTVRRVIKSGEPRTNLKPRINRPPKLNLKDIRRLIRAVTSLTNDK